MVLHYMSLWFKSSENYARSCQQLVNFALGEGGGRQCTSPIPSQYGGFQNSGDRVFNPVPFAIRDRRILELEAVAMDFVCQKSLDPFLSSL